MLVPRFWSEAKAQEKIQGRNVVLKRFGWSDISEDDARIVAEARALQAMEEFKSGKDLARAERKVSYNGADGVPIREEIVSTHGDTVITRNIYGARCLNTPDVLFADVDFYQTAGFRHFLGAFFLLVGVSYWGLGFLALTLKWTIFAALTIAGALVVPLMRILRRMEEGLYGSDEERSLRAINGFLNQRPEWRLSVYRTPAGLRLLALHALFDPAGEEATMFFHFIGVDPIYQQMCVRQRCFRARVSAKPWRIGIQEHLKPRPGVWPIKESRMPQRRAWVEAYENMAALFAACEHLGDFGTGSTQFKTMEVKKLHDQLCQTGHGLPIA